MHPRTTELLAYLNDQRAVLKSAFDSIPPEMRDRAPSPESWSASNVIEHLAIVERRTSILLSRLISSARAAGLAAETRTDAVLPTLDVARTSDRTTRVNAPETAWPTGLDAESAWEALESATESLHKMVASGDGLALDAVSHPHPALGPMSIYQWIAFIGAHEARHAAQIREIIPS
ncbi:MAG TPA: DinB family protein [Terriglobia bacterium]|nr:DinB family protein [Terriglobia bacterium]